MSELLNILMYAGGAVAALILSGFLIYYAGRLFTLGALRTLENSDLRDRLQRRTT